MSIAPRTASYFGGSMEYDKIGAAHGNARTLGEKAQIMGDARIDAAQSFADARIDAAKQGLAQANSQAGGIVRQGFMNGAMNAISGGIQGNSLRGTPTTPSSPGLDFSAGDARAMGVSEGEAAFRAGGGTSYWDSDMDPKTDWQPFKSW